MNAAPPISPTFDTEAAFSRNIGWVTPAEQTRLSGARVAVGAGYRPGAFGSHRMP